MMFRSKFEIFKLKIKTFLRYNQKVEGLMNRHSSDEDLENLLDIK